LAFQGTGPGRRPQEAWPHCQESPKAGIATVTARPNPFDPEKAKGTPKGALQKLKRLVRAEYLPLALKDLVMKAHVPVPFDR
jgi:hypothetical protein